MRSDADGAPPVWTIGYGSRTVEELVAALDEHGITCVVDVRSSPYSRFRPEFSREPLERALRARGFRYVFLGDALGGRPDAPECYVDGKVDYARLARRPEYGRGIERVLRARARGVRLALLCSEGRPEECHRSKLIGATLAERGVPALHIDEDGAAQTQEAVIARLTGGQLGLFGEPEFHSRKRYGQGGNGEPGGQGR